jgi:hypothetical protein
VHTTQPRQLRFSFPHQTTFNEIAFPPGPPPGREATIRERQPKRFPPGWFARSLDNPNWQADHFAEWSARRKAAGLPFVVREEGVA